MEDDTNSLSENDPYREIEENTRAGLRPSLPGDNAQKNASAAEKLRGAEEATTTSDFGGNSNAYENESKAGFVNSVTGDRSRKNKKTKLSKGSIKKALPLIMICGAIIGVLLLLGALSSLLPFHVDSNVVSELFDTFPTVKESVANSFAEGLSNGSLPDSIVNKLNDNGIKLGVISTSGEFVETNSSIAGGPGYEIAAVEGAGFVAAIGSNVIQYNGKVITAENFMDEFHTDAALNNAFTMLIGGQSVIFYDRSGEEVFENLGIDRDPYHTYVETDDPKVNQENFEALFAKMLDFNTNIPIAGEGDEPSDDGDGDSDINWEGAFGGDGDYSSDGSGQSTSASSAEEYVREIANKTTGSSPADAVTRASALINAAISANEPYQASRAFSGILIAIEQAKSGHGGPINEVTNLLTRSTTSSKINRTTGEKEESFASPLQAINLTAAIGNTDYSPEAAAGYSRDRMLNVGQAQIAKLASAELTSVSISDVYDAVNDTVVSFKTTFFSLFRLIGSLFSGSVKTTTEVLVKFATPSVSDALYTNASETFVGENLGERIIEGGAFLNSEISKNIGGASASDSAAIAEYSGVVQNILAREAEMERTRLSPFDITSNNTFFGSIVSNLYPIFYSSSSIMETVSSVNGIVSKSVASLLPGAFAESNNSYQMTFGNCPTPKSINAEGDIFCNKITTFDPEVITMKYSDLESKLNDGGQLTKQTDGSVTINDNSGLAQYTILEVDRESEPGVKDANVCEALKKSRSIIGRIWAAITEAVGLKQSCTGADADIATGRAYANSSDNRKWDDEYKYYQGFFLKTYSRELLGYYDNSENPTVAFKEKYYAENPKDNSTAGIIARRTGWSKEDVIAGIEAIRYIAYLNAYDPSKRFAFFEKPAETEFHIDDSRGAVGPDTIAMKMEIAYIERRKLTQIT